MNKRTNIIGAEISATNMEDLEKNIKKIISLKKTDYICVSNVHTTVMTKKDEYFKNIINSSFMSIPDGMPLVWVQHKMGNKDVERTAGPDVIDMVIKMGLGGGGYKHYFYGSTQEILDQLKVNLENLYKGIQIVGSKASVFRKLTEEEDKELVDEINRLSPDIIWVGLGAPRQESFMYEHKHKIKSGLMIGVGGVFSIYAGVVDRAPQWIQDHGLEWFYRFLKEPGRLWKRYLVTNSLFIWYLFFNNMKSIFKQTNCL